MEKIMHTLIKQLCDKKGIQVKELSYGYILQLEKDDKIRHIIDNMFDLNKEASRKYCL